MAVTSRVQRAWNQFSEKQGFFMASALAFDFLLYSMPIFLFGAALLNKFGEEHLRLYFWNFFQELFPESGIDLNALFPMEMSANIGLHPINIVFLLVIGARLFQGFRVISEIIFELPERHRFLIGRVKDFLLFLVLGTLFGLFVTTSFVIDAVRDVVLTLDTTSGFFLFFVGVIEKIFRILLLSVLFFAIFAVHGKRHLGWKAVFVGALVTTVLFEASKFILDGYTYIFASSTVFYGVFGAFLFYFFWLYYSAVIIIFGACIAWSWSQ